MMAFVLGVCFALFVLCPLAALVVIRLIKEAPLIDESFMEPFSTPDYTEY